LRMADVIRVDSGAHNLKVPTLFQVADVDTGVINKIHADLVNYIVAHCRTASAALWRHEKAGAAIPRHPANAYSLLFNWS